MTIEKQWIEIMKIEVPQAFTNHINITPSTGFIDAQIKLMAMPQQGTWESFIRHQFQAPILAMHAMGIKTPILAFDDYSLVPKAKSITQAKRREKLVPIQFSNDDSLPEIPPESWANAMVNRIFKHKVVKMIIETLPLLIKDILSDDHGFILDYDGPSCAQYVWKGQNYEILDLHRPQVSNLTSVY
jgi:hypothetical protein